MHKLYNSLLFLSSGTVVSKLEKLLELIASNEGSLKILSIRKNNKKFETKIHLSGKPASEQDSGLITFVL